MIQAYQIESKEESLFLVSLQMSVSVVLSTNYQRQFSVELDKDGEHVLVCTNLKNNKKSKVLKCISSPKDFIIINDDYKDERSVQLIDDCITYHMTNFKLSF